MLVSSQVSFRELTSSGSIFLLPRTVLLKFAAGVRNGLLRYAIASRNVAHYDTQLFKRFDIDSFNSLALKMHSFNINQIVKEVAYNRVI